MNLTIALCFFFIVIWLVKLHLGIHEIIESLTEVIHYINSNKFKKM